MVHYNSGGSRQNSGRVTNDKGVSKWDIKPDGVVVPEKQVERACVRQKQDAPAATPKRRPSSGRELELTEFRKPKTDHTQNINQRPVQQRKSIQKCETEYSDKKYIRKDEESVQAAGYENSDSERFAVRNRMLKKTVVILAIVLIVCIVCVAAYQIMLIDTVIIEGNNKLSDEYVIEKTGIKSGTHVFVIDENEVKDSLESDPRIEYLSMKYSFPDKIIISIKEHNPAACFLADGKYVVIDSGGKVLDIRSDASVAIVKGLSAVSFKAGETVSTDNAGTFDILTELLTALEKYDLAQSIREINLENLHSIGYMLYTGMNIKLGTNVDFDKKVYFADKVNAELSAMNKTTGLIDVSYGDQAIYTNPVTENTQQNSNSLNYNLHDIN